MISICIVNWNTRDFLQECLQALEAHPPAEEYEIIVVDNASPDGSAQMVQKKFPAVKLIANEENLFYAKASNQALQMARGDLVMLLNPDVQVQENCLNRLAEFLCAHPEAAGAAPRLIYPSHPSTSLGAGKPQASCRSFPTPRNLLLDILGLARLFPGCRVCGEYRLSYFKYDKAREVDQPMASALMLKAEALKQMGGFDEGFPMFFNDVDLSLRLYQAGWKIYFVPEAAAVHHYGASTAQRKKEMIAQSHDSLARFYRKHYQGRVSWLGYWAVMGLNWLGKKIRLLMTS